jgi:hypothetical protein
MPEKETTERVEVERERKTSTDETPEQQAEREKREAAEKTGDQPEPPNENAAR